MPTALIVEDDPQANLLLSRLIQLRGYQTCSALTGAEALAMVASERPDVVFLDLMLPDTNGFDVCIAMRSRRETSLIPLVIVTARLAEESRVRSFQIGANEFVAKPYTPDQIFEALDAASAWRREFEHETTSGRIRFVSPDDLDLPRDLARLRGILLAYTPLDAAAIETIIESLNALATVQPTQVTTGPGIMDASSAMYAISDDRLTISLQPSWCSSAVIDCFQAIELHAFDEISSSVSPGKVNLIKRFPS